MAERVFLNLIEEKKVEPAPITPDFLPPESKINELYYRLYNTPSGRRFLQDKTLVGHSKRGTKVPTSGWENSIPAVHLILGDKDPEIVPNNFKELEKTDLSKYSVIGTALHELSALTGLINFGRLQPYQIQKSFPTYKVKSLTPYTDALNNSQGLSIFEIWKNFRTHPALTKLIDDEDKWIIQEFPEIPLSKGLKYELSVRKSKDVLEAGYKLIPYLLSEKVWPESNIYFETGSVFNWEYLSENDSRVQIPNRYDSIHTYMKGGYIHIVFSDIKTGKPKLDYANKFQALLMDFMAGHLTKNRIREGKIIRKAVDKEEGWLFPKSKSINHKKRNYEFVHNYFNTKTGEFKTVPIIIDYSSEKGELFLKWLAFYSDAFNALKTELKDYLQIGILPQFSGNAHTQEHFPQIYQLGGNQITIDLSNIPPSRPKPEKQYEGSFYEIGGKPRNSNEICDRCRAIMSESYIKLGRDLGGQKQRVLVRYECSLNKNHYETEWIAVDKRGIILKD